MKKKATIFILLMLLLTGCTNLSSNNLDSLLPVLLDRNSKLQNVVFDGYKYYVPKGLKFITKDEYNATFMDSNNNTYYFYADVVSYYNKEKLDYKEKKDIYYSKKLAYKKKEGYLEIRKFDNQQHYFIEYMYNYGKVEAIVKEKDITEAVTNMSNLLTSLKFNRMILETLIGNKVLNYKEETYNVMTPKGEKANTESYLDYEEKYGTYDGYTPKDTDEDEIKIEEEDTNK